MFDPIKSLEKHLGEFDFNSRVPFYNDSSDYTTNAPSYYDDLARKNKLIKHLALRIWDYDKELAKRFEAWDKNLEEFDDEVLKLLQEWMSDGTFDEIINEVLFGNLNEKIDYLLLQDKRRPVNVKVYGAVGDGITDDTESIQNAVDNVKDGDILIFPIGVYLISKPINIPKPIIIKGDSALNSEIKLKDQSKRDFGTDKILNIYSSDVTVKHMFLNVNGINNYLINNGRREYKNGLHSAIYVKPLNENEDLKNINILYNKVLDGENLIYISNRKLYIDNDIGLTKNVNIIGNIVDLDRANGIILISGVFNANIIGNRIYRNYYHSIRVYHSSKDVIIKNNICFNDYDKMPISIYSNDSVEHIPRSGISVAKGSAGSEIDSILNITVDGNIITNINFEDKPTVNNSVIMGIGVGLYTRDVKIINNTINGSIGHGITARGGQNTGKVIKNNIIKNTNSSGIFVSGSNGGQVIGNFVENYDLINDGFSGIHLSPSSQNYEVEGNFVRQFTPNNNSDLFNNTDHNNNNIGINNVRTSPGYGNREHYERFLITKGEFTEIPFTFEARSTYQIILTMDSTGILPDTLNCIATTGQNFENMSLIKTISENSESTIELRNTGTGSLEFSFTEALGLTSQYMFLTIKKIR